MKLNHISHLKISVDPLILKYLIIVLYFSSQTDFYWNFSLIKSAYLLIKFFDIMGLHVRSHIVKFTIANTILQIPLKAVV